MTGLTVKQNKFVTAVATHGNATQAVLDAGYSVQDRISAKAIGAENLAKPIIRTALETALAQRGIDDLAIAKGIDRLLASEKGSDVARGIEILLKIRGDVAPKKSVQVNLSYAERVKHSLYVEDFKQQATEKINQKPSVFCLTAD